MGGCAYFGFQQIKTYEAEQKSPTSPLQQDSCSAFNSAAVYGRPALIQAPLLLLQSGFTSAELATDESLNPSATLFI